MHTAKFRLLAWQDISEITKYLAGSSGSELAERFLDAILMSVLMLQQMPATGTPCRFSRAELSGVRRWPVKGFERWLIFYQPNESSIHIIRVLHGSLNLDEIFD